MASIVSRGNKAGKLSNYEGSVITQWLRMSGQRDRGSWCVTTSSNSTSPRKFRILEQPCCCSSDSWCWPSCSPRSVDSWPKSSTADFQSDCCRRSISDVLYMVLSSFCHYILKAHGCSWQNAQTLNCCRNYARLVKITQVATIVEEVSVVHRTAQDEARQTQEEIPKLEH